MHPKVDSYTSSGYCSSNDIMVIEMKESRLFLSLTGSEALITITNWVRDPSYSGKAYLRDSPRLLLSPDLSSNLRLVLGIPVRVLSLRTRLANLTEES